MKISEPMRTKGVHISSIIVAKVPLITHLGPIALLGEEVTQEDSRQTGLAEDVDGL